MERIFAVLLFLVTFGGAADEWIQGASLNLVAFETVRHLIK